HHGCRRRRCCVPQHGGRGQCQREDEKHSCYFDFYLKHDSSPWVIVLVQLASPLLPAGYTICSVTCWECDKEPLVPVMVRVKVPWGVVGGCLVRISNPDVPEPVTGAGGTGN